MDLYELDKYDTVRVAHGRRRVYLDGEYIGEVTSNHFMPGNGVCVTFELMEFLQSLRPKLTVPREE